MRFSILLFLAAVTSTRAASLSLAGTIPLPNVEGRIDHFALDGDARLFVAALGNNTVEVVDLKQGKVVHSIGGLAEPQGIAYIRESNRLYVANGGDGAVRVFDGTTFAPVTTIKFDDDADNVRYDATTKQLFVGYGGGAIGIIDPEKNVALGEIPVSAHPESFQLDPNGAQIYVNVPRSHEVAVLDRRTKTQTAKWSLGLVAANFPLALDAANHRAFVGCRMPARLLVFDTASGRQLAKVDLHGDCDDVFYDAAHRRVYASCGEGYIDVFAPRDADRYERIEAIATVPRARTCAFDGAHLYLAVPRQGDAAAAIRVYRVAAGDR